MTLDDKPTGDPYVQPQDDERVEGAATQSQGQAVVGQAGEAIVVERPAPGQTVEIQALAGQTYVLDFPADAAQVQVQGDNFILGFDDNGDGTVDSRIVFLDLVTVAEGADAPTFQIAGNDIGSDVLIGQALALAGQGEAPLEEVAAPPEEPTGGGETVYRDDFGDTVGLLDAEGVIPPTELQFGLIELEDEILLLEEDDEVADTPPEADPVLTPASQPDGGEGGGLPPELQDALNQLDGIPAGWTTLGTVGITDGSFGITPQQGSAQLTLVAEGADDSTIEAFFGLPAGTFDSLPGVDDAEDGSAIKTTLTVQAGDQVTFHFNFLDREQYDGDPGFNDFAYVVFGGEVVKLADVLGTDSPAVATTIGNIAQTGYNEITVTFTAGGDFVFGFGVMNEDDTDFDSGLLIDSVVHKSGESETFLTGFESADASDVVFFKQLDVDGDIGDDDTGEVADFGGADAETALGDLTFTLLSPPTYGQLILVTSGGTASFLNPGNTFTSEDTVWWIATEEDIADFLSSEGAPEFLPNVEFDYSVTDEAGNVATAPVVITIPREVTPPEVALDLYGGDCIEEDSLVSDFTNQVTVNVAPDGDDLLTEIVLSGFQTDWTYDLSGLDTDGAGGAVTVTDNIAGDGTVTITFSPGTNVAYNGSFGVQPPADSDVDHPTITATANVVDPADPTLTASGDNTIDIHVDAVVDGSEVTQTSPAEGDEDTTIALNLEIDLGGDSTTGPGESQGGTDKDGSESVTRLVVMLSLGTLGWVLPASIAEPVESPDGTWTFDTSGAGLSDVQSLVSSLSVTPPEDFDGDITVTVETTTAEAATEAGPNGGSGEECDDGDNVDVDSYEFTVTVNPTDVPPVLIVGENVDDEEGQSTPHEIDETSDDPVTGPIEGNDGDDVLIGDVGGGSLLGKVMNLVLVLDTTGSMEEEISFGTDTISRIEALDRAVEALLQNISEADGATVRVHMVSFASDVKKIGTFDIISNGTVNATALQNAKDFILAADDNPLAVADGNTNYEAGFQAALDWFSSPGNLLPDPDFNKTIFISDGKPNEAYRGNGTSVIVTTGNAGSGPQDALDHVLGQFDHTDPTKDDTVSEYQELLNAMGSNGTIDAIGINVDADGLAILDQVDSNDADSIDEGQELVDVLDSLTEVTELAAVGSDVIVGNGGNDLIFGDTVFTDDLKSQLSEGHPGESLAPGSGWSVIEALIDDGFFDALPGDTLNQKIMAFLRDPENQEAYNLGGETLNAEGVGREGGHDSIGGGAGNDTIFGQEGNDTILGGDGDDVIIGGSGDDSMTGGDGADTFVWTSATKDGEADIITDFELGADGDVLDLAGLLTGVPGGADGADLDDYLSFNVSGGDTTITVDFDGVAGGESSTITLQGVDVGPGTAEDIINNMLGNGNLTVS